MPEIQTFVCLVFRHKLFEIQTINSDFRQILTKKMHLKSKKKMNLGKKGYKLNGDVQFRILQNNWMPINVQFWIPMMKLDID